MLLAHSWDVSTTGSDGTDWPLLWHTLQYPDLVTYCLDHGARVDIPDTPPHINADGTQSRYSQPRPTVLGTAVKMSTIETFELLRSKGAPLDSRTLHLAVDQAAIEAPAEHSDTSAPYTRLVGMIRHLVDAVGLDVNAVEHRVGSMCTTPLRYIARRGTDQDFGQLVHFL